jgi:hypothetical protein
VPKQSNILGASRPRIAIRIGLRKPVIGEIFISVKDDALTVELVHALIS